MSWRRRNLIGPHSLAHKLTVTSFQLAGIQLNMPTCKNRSLRLTQIPLLAPRAGKKRADLRSDTSTNRPNCDIANQTSRNATEDSAHEGMKVSMPPICLLKLKSKKEIEAKDSALCSMQVPSGLRLGHRPLLWLPLPFLHPSLTVNCLCSTINRLHLLSLVLQLHPVILVQLQLASHGSLPSLPFHFLVPPSQCHRTGLHGEIDVSPHTNP